ncbi:MAG: helix-turn-helix transcriptional regulator [Longimicrobiaceae bacterium]
MSGAKNSQLGDTRGKLLALLCSADRTNSELARELGISTNGVRGHLVRLEEEGLVEHRVVRRGVGKPAHEYHLTSEGSVRLSRAYLPLLSGLLVVVGERAGAGEEETLLREAGRALAPKHSRLEGALRERADAAANLLRKLGGVNTVREDTDGLSIHGVCCPLRALVPDHPLACKAIEAMLAEFIGAPVREQCEKHDPPACRLIVGAAEER